MGVRFIDDALYNKIQKWVKDPNMRILKPDESARLFQINADLNNDANIKLPLIALSRDSDVEVIFSNKKPLSFDGINYDSSEAKIQTIDAIPIEVHYQLDIYTKNYDEGDEYLRNFIFNFVNHPKLTITLPYNGAEFEHNANVRIDSTITDTSDIPQRLFSGQFTRWTIKLNVDDCYLFSLPVKNKVTLEIGDHKIKDSKTGEEETEK